MPGLVRCPRPRSGAHHGTAPDCHPLPACALQACVHCLSDIKLRFDPGAIAAHLALFPLSAAENILTDLSGKDLSL